MSLTLSARAATIKVGQTTVDLTQGDPIPEKASKETVERLKRAGAIQDTDGEPTSTPDPRPLPDANLTA